MDNRPIGVFDSGIGGLTTVRELMALLPGEDIIYFGDTGRVPYGNHSRETIIRYTQQDIGFLLSHDVKIVVAACGTVSSTFPPALYEKLPVPYINVIHPAVQTACALSQAGRIGVIGTRASVRSNAYGKAIHSIRPDAHVFGCACPLFVPLAENGHITADDPIAPIAAKFYLDPLKKEGIDTLILGCTHYPLLFDIINKTLDYAVTLVDAGKETARAVQSYLTVQHMLCDRGGEGGRRYYMTDSAEEFCGVAKLFLGTDILRDAHQVELC